MRHTPTQPPHSLCVHTQRTRTVTTQHLQTPHTLGIAAQLALFCPPRPHWVRLTQCLTLPQDGSPSPPQPPQSSLMPSACLPAQSPGFPIPRPACHPPDFLPFARPCPFSPAHSSSSSYMPPHPGPRSAGGPTPLSF